MADDAMRRSIEQAHERAIARAIDYLEQDAFKGEKSLIIASFQQSSSREGTNPIPDPLLHTHAIAPPIIHDNTANQIISLYPHAKELYCHKMAAGAIYRAELASELQQSPGIALQREKSWFELKGFSRENGKYQPLMNYFSSRRLQIEAENPQNAIEAQKVAYQTRQKKQPTATRSQLMAQWQETSRQYGFGLKQVQKLIQAPLERTVIGQKWQEWRTLREAATNVVRHQSHFTRRDLVRSIAEAAQTRGLNGEDVLRLTDKYLISRHIITLGLVERDERFANKRLYKLEKQLLAQVRKLETHRTTFRVSTRYVRTAAAHHRLTNEQLQVLQAITSKGQIKVLNGLSGTGKTHTLAAACQVWESQSYEVLGISLSGRQAERLAEQTGMGRQSFISKVLWGEKQQSLTLSKLFWDIDRATESQRRYGRRSVVRFPLSAKTVVIADNAQGFGVTQMKRLVEEVRRAGAKLVLSGDLNQPQAYVHSGALSAIAKSIGSVELKQIHRQEQPWAQQVVLNVGKGQAKEALQALAVKGLLSITKTKEAAVAEVIQDWSLRGLKRPQDHLIIAETPEDAQVLNRLVQAKLIAEEKLGKTAVKVGTEYIRKGDRVKFQETSRTYGVTKNGMGTVKHIDPITKVAMVRLDTGKLKAINVRHYSGMNLGYAVTTTGSKDLEVRHAYILTQGSGKETALVQISRAKAETKVYAYSLEKETEAELKLARQLSWKKQRELAVTLKKQLYEKERER